MKNLGILSSESLFLSLASLRATGQGICNSIGLSMTIADSKVVPGRFPGLSNLPGTKALIIHKLAEIFVVGEDEDHEFAIL